MGYKIIIILFLFGIMLVLYELFIAPIQQDEEDDNEGLDGGVI